MKNKLINNILIYTCLVLFMISSCATATTGIEYTLPQKEPSDKITPVTTKADTLTEEAISVIARKYAALETPGGRVLKAAVEMVDQKVVVLGSCYGYVNQVYEKAQFPAEKRVKVYKAPEEGPYVDPGLIRPGDWIIYRNLPYGQIGHSAIFVEWIDFDRRSALTIEYVGINRDIPGRYREADITKTYGVLRGME